MKRNIIFAMIIVILSTSISFGEVIVEAPYPNDGNSYYIMILSSQWAQIFTSPEPILVNTDGTFTGQIVKRYLHNGDGPVTDWGIPEITALDFFTVSSIDYSNHDIYDTSGTLVKSKNNFPGYITPLSGSNYRLEVGGKLVIENPTENSITFYGKPNVYYNDSTSGIMYVEQETYGYGGTNVNTTMLSSAPEAPDFMKSHNVTISPYGKIVLSIYSTPWSGDYIEYSIPDFLNVEYTPPTTFITAGSQVGFDLTDEDVGMRVTFGDLCKLIYYRENSTSKTYNILNSDYIDLLPGYKYTIRVAEIANNQYDTTMTFSGVQAIYDGLESVPVLDEQEQVGQGFKVDNSDDYVPPQQEYVPPSYDSNSSLQDIDVNQYYEYILDANGDNHILLRNDTDAELIAYKLAQVNSRGYILQYEWVNGSKILKNMYEINSNFKPDYVFSEVVYENEEIEIYITSGVIKFLLPKYYSTDMYTILHNQQAYVQDEQQQNYINEQPPNNVGDIVNQEGRYAPDFDWGDYEKVEGDMTNPVISFFANIFNGIKFTMSYISDGISALVQSAGDMINVFKDIGSFAPPVVWTAVTILIAGGFFLRALGR